MGPCPGAFYVEGVQRALEMARVEYVIIDLLEGSRNPEQVGSILTEVGRFTSCIVLGWGSGGCDIEVEFGESKAFRIS